MPLPGFCIIPLGAGKPPSAIILSGRRFQFLKTKKPQSGAGGTEAHWQPRLLVRARLIAIQLLQNTVS
jgi:hypothetical protein